MRLSTLLRGSVAAAVLAAASVPVGGAAPNPATPPARSPLEVKVAETPEFSRIEFAWAGGARAASRRDGQTVTLRFSRNATPDISRLRVFPPKWLKGAEQKAVGGGLEVKLFLTDDADAKVGFADGATYVNVFERKIDPNAPATPPPSVAAVPDGGTVRVTAEATAAQISLKFPWKAPLGAAVFRRGDEVWAVFDTKAGMDFSRVPKTAAQYTRLTSQAGADYTAVRITAPAGAVVSARAEGATWVVTLGTAAGPKPTPVVVGRDAESPQAALSAALAGATRPVWLDDPATGERLAVITALAPSKGLETRRRFVDLEFLPSAQGLVVAPYAPDVTVSLAGDIVRVGRPNGLKLSSIQSSAAENQALADAPQAAALPCMIDFANWSKLGPKGFFHRYDELLDAAMAESDKDGATPGRSAPVAARMALARFLMGSELPHETIGTLNLLASSNPAMLNDEEFRGLRGTARAMIGRYAEAQVDLSSPALAGDPSAALWRGYVAAKTNEWADARKAFSQGYLALDRMGPKWKARFARADAEAGLSLNDMRTARTEVAVSFAAGAGPEEDAMTGIIQARIYETDGDKTRALGIYDALARSPNGALAAEATLRATQLRSATGQIAPAQAADIYDGLRYRWRGDSTELQAVRALGKIYLSMGRYREALLAMSSMGQRMNGEPEKIALQNDLSNAFRGLFLDGGADGWEPIQAVGLFRDFQYLTPIGADGDQMARKMAQRLVDVDLLDQAAYLLQWQVDNRLDGIAKAQVATRLALIYLMDRKPEQALVTINSSRTTVLPTVLNNERRALTARALIALNRFDQALEILGNDKSQETEDLRAEVAWKKRDWKLVGPALERRLGDRWKSPAPLTVEEEARLLRAAIAFSLDDDDVSLARLRERYDGFLETARAPEYLRIGLVGIGDARLAPSDFSRVIAEGDTFNGWVTRMKKRFREPGVPIPPPARQTAALPPPVQTPSRPAPAAKG